MRVKKAGGRIFGGAMSAAEKKAMDLEIQRQLAEYDQKHLVEIDAMILWVLHEQFGFGPKRLRQYYDSLASLLADSRMSDGVAEQVLFIFSKPISLRDRTFSSTVRARIVEAHLDSEDIPFLLKSFAQESPGVRGIAWLYNEAGKSRGEVVSEYAKKEGCSEETAEQYLTVARRNRSQAL